MANNIQSISLDKTNAKVLELVESGVLQGETLLDVGAGEGYFVQLLGEKVKRENIAPSERIAACDINPAEFKYAGVECKQANFHESFPFDDGQFDVVTSIEVIEHLEDQFHFVRELFRITKEGGCAIVTTPNILNINSRVRNFTMGFGLLYDILPLYRIEPTRLSGHIHPISLYYLAYTMYRAGFKSVEVHYDRIKKSGLFLSVLFYPLIRVAYSLYRMKAGKKKKELLAENLHILNGVNSLSTLASRTIVVVGKK